MSIRNKVFDERAPAAINRHQRLAGIPMNSQRTARNPISLGACVSFINTRGYEVTFFKNLTIFAGADISNAGVDAIHTVITQAITGGFVSEDEPPC